MECQSVVAFFPAFRGDQRDALPACALQLIVQDGFFRGFFYINNENNTHTHTENIKIHQIGMCMKSLSHPGHLKADGFS